MFFSDEILDIQEKVTKQCSPTEAATMVIKVDSCIVSGDNYDLKVGNVGQGNVDGLRVRLIDDQDQALSILNPWYLAAGDSGTYTMKSTDDIGVAKYAEVLPFFIQDGNAVVCDQSLIKVNCKA